MLIRRSTKDDLEDFLTLRELSIRGLASTTYPLDQIDDWVKNYDFDFYQNTFEQGIFHLIILHNSIIGGGAWDGEEIGHLYISPDYAGQGYGSTLLSELEADYKEQQPEMAHILAQASNNARCFYEKNGYVFVEEKFNENSAPYSVMKKTF